MKAKIYAITLIVAFLAGAVGVFVAASYSLWSALDAVIGFAIALFVVPAVHEFGHVSFACAKKFKIVYCKFFCFKFYQKEGKLRFAFASPFAPDETRTLPTSGDDIKKRVLPVICGGLLYSGILTLLIAAAAVVLLCFGYAKFELWGMLPYASYIFLLNAFPVEYASGKTDALVYQTVKKEEVEGKAFLAAMEIQGRLCAGERFVDLPETLYETYGLREDDSLFATLWELKYRYFLEKGELAKAADALNRLIAAAEYLSEEAYILVRIESAYLCLLQKDATPLKQLLESDERLLRSEDYRVKRLLATYSYALGEKGRGRALVTQAKQILEKEPVLGVRKHEEILLSRLDG